MTEFQRFDPDWFRRVWWGQLSLATTFWKVFVVGWFCSAIVGGFTCSFIYLVCPPAAGFFLLLMLFVYPLWATVGVWRSANSGKSRAVWGVMAKGISGFYFVVILFRAVTHSQQIMGMLTAR
jgi:hypothetical protein